MAEKLKLGVIGAGGFANWHLDGISQLDFVEVVAISDKYIEKAKQKAEKYNIPNYYQDHKDVLAHDEIVAVTLPLPDQVHAEIAIDAMRAGKHVLCEKPMALNREDCVNMIKVSRETGMKLMVGQIGRYTPSFIVAKQIVDSGEIGEMTFIESEYAHDYNASRGTDDWRVTPERHPILGGGCHAIDLIRMIAGDPEEVFAYANNKGLPGWPINEATIACMKFPNGVIGKVFNSHGCKREYTMRTVVQGTKGTIIFDNTHPHISIYKENFRGEGTDELYFGVKQKTCRVDIHAQINNHNAGAEIGDFCRAIQNNTDVVSDGVSGASTVAVGLAIIKSVETGLPQKVEYDF